MALVYDHYLDAIYDREAFTRELTERLVQLGARRILDCAAGTGFPALDLHRTGAFEVVHCTDGSQDMIDQLRRNARSMGISAEELTPRHRQHTAGDPMCVRWQDLDRLEPVDYDYVLCRGNSLVYLDTWSGEGTVAAEDNIRAALRVIGSRVKPGGWLHIDGPKELKSYPSWHVASFTRGTDEFVLREKVTVQEHSRRWDLYLKCDGEHQGVSFHGKFVSAHLDIGHLEKLIDQYCFSTLRTTMGTERPQFGVVLARKMANTITSELDQADSDQVNTSPVSSRRNSPSRPAITTSSPPALVTGVNASRKPRKAYDSALCILAERGRNLIRAIPRIW